MGFWFASFLALVLVKSAPINEPSNGTSTDLQSSLQILSQSQVQQYEGSNVHLNAEFAVLKQFAPSTIEDIIEIQKQEDEAYDRLFNISGSSSFHGMNCTQAPQCEALHRQRCFAKEHTCGVCLEGFYGTPGDANTECVPISCADAPDCASLNRLPCGKSSPNTCGPCLDNFHTPSSSWFPNEPNVISGNDMCLAVKFRPVVFVHGLGDTFQGFASSFPASLAKRSFHVLKTFAAEPGGGVFSMTKPLAEMVNDFAREVRAIPGLQHGFNVVGISQGGLIARAYIEKFNDPPVYNFVSIHSPQTGIARCPGVSIDQLPCTYAMHLGMVTPHDYWRGPDSNGEHSKAVYLNWNHYLQDINNEGNHSNSTYRDHMISLNRYVLVKAEKDRTVIPADSEWHGYFQWGNMSNIVPMQQTEEYINDVIGLRTLDEQHKIVFLKTPGGHVHVTGEFFEELLYRYFDNGWYEDGTEFDLESYYQKVVSKASLLARS